MIRDTFCAAAMPLCVFFLIYLFLSIPAADLYHYTPAGRHSGSPVLAIRAKANSQG